MILASIEGAIGAAVITLVMLAIRWFGGRFGGNRADAKGDNARSRSPAALGARGDSEEERMRRFLEALGIPSDAPEGQRPATPPPLRPAQRREEPQKKPVSPVPPILGEPWPKPQKRQPPPLVRRPEPKPSRRAEPPLTQAPPPMPASPMAVAEVRPPEITEFWTTTADDPLSQDRRDQGALVGAGEGTAQPAAGELWRQALRSPEGLRSAFILREVLGPPPGLQSR